MLVLGDFRAVLGPAALASLETAGDSERCLGRMAGPPEYLGHGSVGGLWTPGLLVEAGITSQLLRREMDRADWTWASISGMNILQLMDVESKACAKSGLALASWWRPF